VKGILLASPSYQCGERLILFQIGLFSQVEETHVPLERNQFVLEVIESSTLFPCEYGLGF
jgi:hypothetical protein